MFVNTHSDSEGKKMKCDAVIESFLCWHRLLSDGVRGGRTSKEASGNELDSLFGRKKRDGD